MGPVDVTREAPLATYEIHLDDEPPDTLVARFAPSRVTWTSAETVLMRRVASQDELAGLLERVLMLGLVLNEVHELRVPSSPSRPSPPVAGQRTVLRAYEVRVDGELDGAALRYLRWPHRHLQEQASVCLEGTAEHVHEFLNACCRLGLGIQRVRRLTSSGTTVPTAAARV